MTIKHFARIKDIPHASAREALGIYNENHIAQLEVLRNLEALPAGVRLIHSSELRITSQPEEVYEDDGNTRCPGTKYDFTALYGLCGKSAPEWHSFHHGYASSCLVFHFDFALRNSDEKIRWGGGYQGSFVGRYRGDKPLVRWFYNSNGPKLAPGRSEYLEAAAILREVWADALVDRELVAKGVK